MSFRFGVTHSLRSATRGLVRPSLQRRTTRPLIASSQCRGIRASPARHDNPFTNILADDNPPAVQVKSITNEGIQLLDGLIIQSHCIFLEGQVFLWDPPNSLWDGWGKEHFEIFDTVLPKPEILLLGTGKTTVQTPAWLRTYLNQLGIQIDVMDTRNACATYNLLAEEGRRVAAALLPLTPCSWEKAKIPRH